MTVQSMFDKAPKRWPKKLGVVLVISFLLLISLPYIQYNEFNPKGLKIAGNIMRYFFIPNVDQLFNFTSTGGVPYLLLETVCIALLGTLIGAALSLPLAFMSSRNITGPVISSIGVVLITIIRCVPPLVYVLIFVQVETGAVAGVLAFSITSIGMVSKLFIEAIEELDHGVIEALDACGASRFQKIRYGILPQLSSNFLSTIIYRFEINVKNATILGMVGAGGVGAELIFAMNAFRWKDATTLLVGIIILVLCIEYSSGKIRNKLIHG